MERVTDRILKVFFGAAGCLALALTQTAIGHQNEASKQSKSLSPVMLLPGYKIEIDSGFEGGLGGTISKGSAVKIDFNQGQYDGNASESVEKEQQTWRIEQISNGKRIICVATKSNEVVMTLLSPPSFPANFHAKIHNQQELAEMLLMVLTYDPRQGYPVDPSAIVNQSEKTKRRL